MKKKFSATTLLVSLLLTASAANAAQKAEVIEKWNVSDETNRAVIDHAPWQALLDTYLVTDDPSGIHLV